MALDLLFVTVDNATSTEVVKRNGIQVELTTVFTREVLIVKIPGQNKLLVQSTAKVNIDMLLNGKNLKIVTKAGAFARSLRGLAGVSRRLKIIELPPGTGFNFVGYTKTLTVALARQVLGATVCQQSLNDRSELRKTLEYLGEVAKNFAICANVMMMKIKGPRPYMFADQTKMFCESEFTITKWCPLPPFVLARSAATGGTEKRKGVKVTKL